MQVERVTVRLHQGVTSGKRVRNTLVTYPGDGHNSPKGELIPDIAAGTQVIRSERSQDAPGGAYGLSASW